MKFSKKDTIQIIGLIKANYTYAYKDISDSSLDLLIETWYESLSCYDKELVNIAFKKAIETCKMPPTLADIIQNIKQMQIATEPTDTELWNKLVTAVTDAQDCIYHFRFYMIESNGKTQSENAKDKFDKIWEELPQVLKDYCGNKSGLYSLTQTDLDYEKNRFVKLMPSIKQRLETRITTNPDILKLASGITKNINNNEMLKLTKIDS